MISTLLNLGYSISENENTFFLKKDYAAYPVTIKIVYEKSDEWDENDENSHFGIWLQTKESVIAGSAIKHFPVSIADEEKEALDNLGRMDYDEFMFSNLSEEERYWTDEEYFKKEKALYDELESYRG
jgi:hypothetical protein